MDDLLVLDDLDFEGVTALLLDGAFLLVEVAFFLEVEAGFFTVDLLFLVEVAFFLDTEDGFFLLGLFFRLGDMELPLA